MLVFAQIFDPRLGRLGPMYGAEYPEDPPEGGDDQDQLGKMLVAPSGVVQPHLQHPHLGRIGRAPPPGWSGPGPPSLVHASQAESKQKVLKQLNTPCQKSMVSAELTYMYRYTIYVYLQIDSFCSLSSFIAYFIR